MSSVPSNLVKQLDPIIPVDQSIYEESSTQKAKLGTRLQVGERVYYYAKLSTSANVTPGYILSAPNLVASHQSGILSVAAATTGAKTLTITAGTAAAAGDYAEGYINISSTGLAGGGVMYKIKNNSAWATASTGTITLYDAIPGSVGAGPVNLVPCLFNGVKVGSAALGLPLGVTPCSVTTGNYFWLQTWGPASVYHSAATPAAAGIAMGTLGGAAAIATGTLGSTGYAPVDYAVRIGKNMSLAATATQCNPVMLTILP